MATQATVAKIPDINAEVLESGILQIAFRTGNTILVDPARLSENIRLHATLHGLKQKLVDAGAIARSTITGRAATITEKESAVMEVYDRITRPDGTWNKVRESGATNTGGLLVAAMMELTGKDRAFIVDYLAEKSNEEKAALKLNQRVAAIILRLQSEKVNAAIDSDSMLDDLMHSEDEVAPEEDADDSEEDYDDEPNTSIDLT